MNDIKPTATLPRIVAVLDCIDHGPCDPEPTATCPHCGADGRYVYHFLCEDGTTRGAMKGCIQLFPRTAASYECEKALAKFNNKKAHVSKWDERVLKALEQFRAGTLPLIGLEAVCAQVKAEKKTWMIMKGYARR